MWEERQGWSAGTAEETTPPAEPADAPLT
jgi:hypothetical protein